ncbi:MAG: MgtC/SapB family protein [Clostridia bacterium]|nr:MgtC/SapB family protein [Clostridia bacterium]
MDKWLLDLIHENQGDGLILYVFLTATIAALLSFFIGLERQLRGEAAGVRTHSLMALGSSLLMTLSIWAIRMADGSIDIVNGTMSADLNYDTSRIAAAVITGIGFLGGGVIVRDKFSVKGLATASTLWICTAIGLACGSGFVLEAVIFTVLTLVLLIILGRLLDFIDDKRPFVILKSAPDFAIAERARDICEANGLELKVVRIIGCDDESVTARVIFIHGTTENAMRYFSHLICRENGVEVIEDNKNHKNEK